MTRPLTLCIATVGLAAQSISFAVQPRAGCALQRNDLSRHRVVPSGVRSQRIVGAASAGSAKADQFRPERASVDPVTINTLVQVLFRGGDVDAAVTSAAKSRELDKGESDAVRERVSGVAQDATHLRAMLDAAVSKAAFVRKYGLEGGYGIGPNVSSDPLLQLHQAECLLALYLMRRHGGDAPVDFLDAERRDVLLAAVNASPSALQARPIQPRLCAAAWTIHAQHDREVPSRPHRRMLSAAPQASAPKNGGFSGLTKGLLTLVGYYKPKNVQARAATALFRACQEQAERKSWHRGGQIGDDFRSRHALLSAHVWVMHKRLILEGAEGQRLQETLFDELWNETTRRLRSVGIGELSVNKYLEEVQQYSFGAMVAYDDAMDVLPGYDAGGGFGGGSFGGGSNGSSGSIGSCGAVSGSNSIVSAGGGSTGGVDAQLAALANAVRLNIYMRDGADMSAQQAAAMAAYMRHELVTLLELPRDAVLEGRVAFGEPPAWAVAASSGRGRAAAGGQRRVGISGGSGPVLAAATAGAMAGADTATEADSDGEVGDWREALTEAGKLYFWNVKTRESRWDRPS